MELTVYWNHCCIVGYPRVFFCKSNILFHQLDSVAAPSRGLQICQLITLDFVVKICHRHLNRHTKSSLDTLIDMAREDNRQQSITVTFDQKKE